MASHGTVSSYNKGCRCIDCKLCARDRARRYRLRIGVAPKPAGLAMTTLERAYAETEPEFFRS